MSLYPQNLKVTKPTNQLGTPHSKEQNSQEVKCLQTIPFSWADYSAMKSTYSGK